MSSEDEYNVAARYRTVRKRLDSLGYQQALSLDALPLIERLLADLIQTTESLKHFKSVAQENIEACQQLQLIIDPYKCDNARLVQEANQLHLDLIEAEEGYQKQIKDLKKQVYKLECECNDLQLASSRNLQKIKDLEIESAKKSKKILDLQGKCLKPIISNVGIANKKRPCYPLRRPVIEAEPLPRVGSSSHTLPSVHTVEPKILDLLSMADHRMSCLTHEVTKLKGELSLQTENVYTLQDQLTTKEREIMRLKKMLEGGRPYNAVIKDCLCKKVPETHTIHKEANEDNDLKTLLKVKQELEQQLKEAISKQHEAMSQAMKLAERNEELEKELKDIDHIALAVEADCNSAVKENNKRVCRLQERLEDVMGQVHTLEIELAAKRREVQELTADLEASKLEKRNIQRTLESTLEEKKRITNKINQLTIIEKSLNDEIERLSKENESQKQDILQLQYTNKVLKEQLGAANIEVYGDDSKQLKNKGEKNDQNRGKKYMGSKLDVENRELSSPVQETSTDRENYKSNNNGISDNIKKLIIEKDKEIDNLQQTIKLLEKERDYYRNEYKRIEHQKEEGSDKENVELRTQSYELRCQLNEKEKTIFELQREKNDLYHEKTKLEARLEAAKNQQKKFCTSCKSCRICNSIDSYTYQPSTMLSDMDTNAKQMTLESLERERDTARADVQRLIEERNALYEQLQTTRRATVNGLEDQLEDLKEELRKTKQELTIQRTQFVQLRALQDQTDQALGDVQGQLTQSESELSKAIERNRNMQQQQLQLDNQVKELKQEINTLHANMAHLDREKDQLLMMLDEKTEKIVALETELMHKEQQVMGMEQQMRDLRHKNEICVDQNAERERQFRSLQMEMENLQRQLENTNADRENAIQENRRLQDDLAAVMYELRNLQHDLDASRVESYDLKKQLQTYVSEVRRAEEMLNKKENERSEMLNHFRSLSLEATVLENNNHSLESEAAEARGALQTAKDRLLDLERQLADKDSLIRGYETQISELTQTVASMETQLRQQTEQKLTAEADLNAVRDLCIKLDQQKDVLVQQLEDKDVMKAQYETQLAGLKAEQGAIQEQMDRDRATVERLEILLDQARQESINVQATNQELQNELSRLRQKISELQSKLSSESLELKQYQNQAAEYSKQISELRRQVTNERFDRARKEEENRRYLCEEKCKDHCAAACKNYTTEAVSLGISNKEYTKSDRGNESTTNNKIQVDFSERIQADVMEPFAASTPEKRTDKSNCISCCRNAHPRETNHIPTIISKSPNQKNIPLRLSKHYIFEPCSNDHSRYPTSYRCVSTQCMEINNRYPIVSDSSECQFFSELEVAGKIMPCCTVPKNVNYNIDKSANSTRNISDKKTNENTRNNTIEDIYIRNITKRLRNNYNSNNKSYQTRRRENVPLIVDAKSDIKCLANCKETFSEFTAFTEGKLIPCNCIVTEKDMSTYRIEEISPNENVTNYKETFSEFDAFTKEKLIPCNCANMENTVSTYKIEEMPPNENIASYKETFSEFDGFTEQRIIPCDCINTDMVLPTYTIEEISVNEQIQQKCTCKSNSYTKLTNTVTKSVIGNTETYDSNKINSIDITNVNEVDDKEENSTFKDPTQSNHCKTIVIIFPKPKLKKIVSDIKEHTKSLEQQITSINNIVKSIIVLSDQKISSALEKENLTILYEKDYQDTSASPTEEFVDENNNNAGHRIKQRAHSTSSLNMKTIYPEPIVTSTREMPVGNEQTSSHVEKEKGIPTITMPRESDQNNVKNSSYKEHKIEQVPHSYKNDTSTIEAHKIEPTCVKSIAKGNRGHTNCNTAYPYHSTMKTTVSNRNRIYDLCLRTKCTQSASRQTVASASSDKLNSNTEQTNLTSSKNHDKKSKDNAKVVPALLNASTTIDDLKPSVSIQCVRISNSSNYCKADTQKLEVKNTPPRDSSDKTMKFRRNRRVKLRKS